MLTTIPSSPLLATTSAPGAMSAADAARFIFAEAVTSVGASVAGDVVRRVSPGVWTPAAADTSANCAGVIGIYNGSTVVPIAGNIARLNFVATPALNSPCYLSTTPGKATNAVPSPSQISIALGVPYIDLSVSTDYAAASSSYIVSAPGNRDICQMLIDDTTATLGVTADQLCVDFCDFEPGDFTNTTTPKFGLCNSGALTQPVAQSCIYATSELNFRSISDKYPWANLNPARCKFRIAARMLSLRNSHSVFNYSPPCDAGNYYQISFGSWAGANVDQTHLYFLVTTAEGYSANPSGSGMIDCGYNDQQYHVFELESPGDQTIRCRFDYGTWSLPITMVDKPTSRTSFTFLNTYGAGPFASKVDWVFVAQQRA